MCPEDAGRQMFSTTGPVERAVMDLVWLDAMQSFFTYQLRSLCGIPEITLEGTPDLQQPPLAKAGQTWEILAALRSDRGAVFLRRLR